MPIYAYRCTACGHAQDVLQRMSDPQLTTCPSCGAEAYAKQVTAAGFQLKGSGWYVTDFRSGNNAPAKPAEAGDAPPAGDAKPADAKPADSKPADAKPATGQAAGTPATAPAAAPAVAGKPAGKPAPKPAAKPPAAGS